MKKESIIKRLAFIKYILNQANHQSRLPEPICASSLLSFHDATELLLHLIAEELNVKVNDNLMDYWNKLNPRLKQLGKGELTQIESMRRLNKARVALKHHGILPSKLDIEDYRALTNTFFQESVKNAFGIDLGDVSLIELISYKKAKEYLKKAEQEFKENKIKECVTNLSISFFMLLSEYENTKRSRYGSSSFHFGSDMTFLSSFAVGLDHNDKLYRFVDTVKNSITSIQRAIKILSFGIDYRKYVKFSLITPHTTFIPQRDEPLVSMSGEPKMSKEEFEFCYNFIIESALKLQEFDFKVVKKEIPEPNLLDF